MRNYHANVDSVQKNGFSRKKQKAQSTEFWTICQRYLFILALALMMLPSIARASNPNNTLVGAIRWDGFVGGDICSVSHKDRKSVV
jgi:hypothetical protein